MHLSVKLRTINSEFNSQNHTRTRVRTHKTLQKFKNFFIVYNYCVWYCFI